MTTKRNTKDKGRKPGRNPKMALRGRCVVRFDPSRAELGGIAASLLDDLSGRSRRYVCDILLAEDRQRVTYGTRKEKAFSVVYRGREGMAFWDNATRSVATIAADGIPRTNIAPAKSIETTTLEKGDEITFTVISDDEGLGRLRHELTVSRREDWAPFGPALMGVLHCGPTCHAHSGLPWEQIAKAGLIIREKTFVEGGNDLISELDLESLELVEVREKDFAPPDGYHPLEQLLKKRGEPRPVPRPSEDAPTPMEIQAAVIKQALDSGSGSTQRALRIKESLTPDCLGSTRFGSVTASLHQDFLTVASNAINMVAPLLGPTTIASGTWTVPWLANLAAVRAASATAPGSGIFCFLRQPRVPVSPPGPLGGGTGLLDRLAFLSLYERDSAGTLRTQREFTASTLPATLATWGVNAATVGNLLAASGDLTMVSLSDQRVITECYETTEVGVFRITGLPGTMTSFPFGSMSIAGVTTPPLFTIRIAGLTGTVDFASLGGGPLITAATIGSSGNFVLGLSLPTTTLTAMVTRLPTGFGVLVITLAPSVFCLAFPLLCPLLVTLASLAAFVMTNVTVVTATATGVTWTLDVRFDFDPTTERLEPFVSLLGRTGVVNVGAFGLTPNIIANFVDALVAALGDRFDGWGALLADQGTKAIQRTLRDQGLQLPVAGRQNELRAIDGSAQSSTGGVLQLSADVRPFDDVANQPFTTQVVTRDLMGDQLLLAHLNIRRDLNPQPTPPPPGPGPILTVGTFAGLGLSQNALNYYIFQQWVQRRFEVTITDPVVISKFIATAPQLFVRFPVRIHLWPATAPRIEIAPHEIALGTRPLVVFFDDVRACFEVPNAQGRDGPPGLIGHWELSSNFKTSATIELAWPWVFGLRVDPIRPSSGVYESRTWEFIDPNVLAIMGAVAPQDLATLVNLIAEMLIAPISATGVGAPVAVRPWTRPLPAMQQEIFPAVQPPAGLGLKTQQAYLEMLARRKALYILPAIDTALLALVDGSSAWTSNSLNLILQFANAPGPIPTTALAMTCAQGSALRDWLFQLIGLPAGP